MKKLIIIFLTVLFVQTLFSQEARKKILLNGVVEFDQTKTALPPKKFTRKIQVPGLIDLAEPKIDQYESYFKGTHEPRYSWYRFKFTIPEEQKGDFAMLTLLKSKFNTQVLLNGHDCGTYMECSTPIQCDLTDFLYYGKKQNILLVRIGERAWLPKEAATGFDREKFTDIPGIWDDVFITFTGPVQVNKALLLPDVAHKKLTAKLKLENLGKFVERNMEKAEIEYNLSFRIREKKSKKFVTETFEYQSKIKCEQDQLLEFEIPFENFTTWSPETPFLYEAVITITADAIDFKDYGNPELLPYEVTYPWEGPSDYFTQTFGMRDFKAVNRHFELNGEEYSLFGSTLTFNRFLEDRERSNLPWDKEWVRKLMIDIPKSLGWNGFRVHIGLLPSFWYDLADEYGLVIQNEYPMWNLRGRDHQFMKEYTNWVWADGNHPSIIIWDALNEQKNAYLANEVIPKLRALDPTRIWDAGYMDASEMSKIEMEEIHWYPLAQGWWSDDTFGEKRKEAFRFGDLELRMGAIVKASDAAHPLVMNEYGWLWLNRDGLKSGIRVEGSFLPEDKVPYRKNYEYYEYDGSQIYHNRDVYDYYVGANATSNENWTFQAYLLSIETETTRASDYFSGIFSFTYLANNKGYTGDWFKDLKNLTPMPALLAQYHTHKRFAAFLDIEDGRYLKNAEIIEPNAPMLFNVYVVNDNHTERSGKITIQLIDSNGNVVSETSEDINEIEPYDRKIKPIALKIPNVSGGFMVKSTLKENPSDDSEQVSIRYIRVGDSENYQFFNYEYSYPANWPMK